MAQTHLRLADGTFMDKSKALNAVLSQIGCAFGHNSIIGRGNSEGTGFATIETSELEAALFALVRRFSQIDGYRCLSLIRALAVVNCQSALA